MNNTGRAVSRGRSFVSKMSTGSQGFLAQFACLLIFGSVSGWENVRSSNTPGSTVSIPAGYSDYPAIGTAYKFHRDRRSWSDAKRICRSEGGRLAVVDGSLKLDQLTSVVEYSSDAWIGLNKNGSQWLAVDGSSPTYIPWAPQNPTGTGNCAGFRATTRAVHNLQCDWVNYFVCEVITGRTTGGGGSNHLYPDLRQIFNPSRGNSSYGNPTQRSPPSNGYPSNSNNPPYGNPTQRNPYQGHDSWRNNPVGSNSSYNNPSHGNPTQGNSHPGHNSWGNNHRDGNSSYNNQPYVNPTESNPWYASQPTRNPYHDGPSNGNPTTRTHSYGTQSPVNPWYGNPSYGNPSWGTASNGYPSSVTPSSTNLWRSNNNWRYVGK